VQKIKKKKRKGIALKVSSTKEDKKEISSDDEDVKNLRLMVKKFGKFFKRSKERKFSNPLKKVESNNNTFTCFECRKQGHIKSDCPIYLRKQLVEKKAKKDRISKLRKTMRQHPSIFLVMKKLQMYA